ncbi:YncE family protein [Methylophaga muralis]|uniref:Lactonase, 7-bladed beta-propeller n=1 Tax=Methylophaga muralis TaxID=291169 RepID=A0A1E3GQY2_9GAMM|nr:beta-propeller fold lactonase family protein [Methylophaga muralis]ODN66459.1 Lactonase, 7-bladed beta-propeller [Methylophaga muralis]
MALLRSKQPDGKFLYVTNQDENTVSVIDIAAAETINTIEVDDSPEGIDITANGKHLYVSNWGSGSVSIIDTETGKRIEDIKTGDGSRAFGDFIISQ